jgi:hypothetical protein
MKPGVVGAVLSARERCRRHGAGDEPAVEGEHQPCGGRVPEQLVAGMEGEASEIATRSRAETSR